MTDYDTINYFTNPDVLEDPFPYYEHLRSKGAVYPTGPNGMLSVTGFDEAVQIYRDNETFSNCNTTSGPFLTLPEAVAGESIGEIIERHRETIPQNHLVVTMDPPLHTRERALLMRLITPSRLKENEAFMLNLADQQLNQVLEAGFCDFVGEFSSPYAMLTIADLLGVPEADHQTFKTGFGLRSKKNPNGKMPDQKGGADAPPNDDVNSLSWLYEWFAAYIEDRRREPKNDVLSNLALAKYPDGSTPEVMNVVHQAVFMFAAGRETSADMSSTAMKYLAENAELQDELRAHSERIPDFIEECLRIDPPVRVDFRLATRAATLAGVEIAPGTPVAIFTGAANRDPRRFESPAEFRIERHNVKEHIAFGRSIHACPGAPLARAEGRITIERILAGTRNIRLSEAHHGPAGDRRFKYSAALTSRSLKALHIEFDRA